LSKGEISWGLVNLSKHIDTKLTPRFKSIVIVAFEFFKRQYNDDTPKVLAAAVLTAIPTILAYVLLQKQFERGMAAGAIK